MPSANPSSAREGRDPSVISQQPRAGGSSSSSSSGGGHPYLSHLGDHHHQGMGMGMDMDIDDGRF